MHHRLKIVLVAAAAVGVTLSSLVIAPAPSASAHGFVGASGSSLIARAAWSANADRGSVAFEPQSLEAPQGFPEEGPADGQLASAGGLFGGVLDEQTASRWAKNVVESGPVQVSWQLTAAHRTASWRYFITTPGWDANAPLDRSDFELLASFDAGGGIPSMTTTHTLTIPADRIGYHVIYAVWDIADTENAFYNVIDIDVRSGGTTPVDPVDPVEPVDPEQPVDPVDPAAPTQLHAMGRTATSVDLMWTAAPGATEYRIERSTDGVAFTAVGATSGATYVDEGLEPVTTYWHRVIAISDDGEAASDVLTTSTRAAATTPEPGVSAWNAFSAYETGDVVQHHGATYRAMQAHQGYGDDSWITALSLWQPLDDLEHDETDQH